MTAFPKTREVRIMCPKHRAYDCSPLLNGCSIPNLIYAELDAADQRIAELEKRANFADAYAYRQRAEAAEQRIAQLERERDALKEQASHQVRWSSNLWQRIEKLEAALRGWEAREAADGMSVVERGSHGEGTLERLGPPMSYDHACAIEEFFDAALRDLDATEGQTP